MTTSLLTKRLSYSSILTFHKCPRKFYLERHQTSRDEKSIHLAYGSSMGVGMQEVMKNSSYETVIFAAFLAWDLDLEEEDVKGKKSFWDAIHAINQFASEFWPSMQRSGWQLLHLNDKATDEFGFKINLPDGFYLLGYLDGILFNKNNNEVRVLETKTTKYTNVHEALYSNSWQGIGYSIVLDELVASGKLESFSSLEVLYLVLKSTAKEFELFPFKKPPSVKAGWLYNMHREVQAIKACEDEDYWPKYGESCWDYASFKPCQFYGVCDMHPKHLFLKDEEAFNEVALAKEKEANEKCFVMNMEDIVARRLEA